MPLFHYNQKLKLEVGGNLPQFELEYTTFGRLNSKRNNVVWICHALTANSDPSDWWDGLVGKNKLYDPQKYFIVCANILGSCYGSTNALSTDIVSNEPYYHSFPLLTVRDIVKGLDLLRIYLNIKKIHILTGGSMGGQQAMEWAIMQPNIVENLILLATNAQHSPWGIAFNESQRMAIANDVTWQENDKGAGLEGMKTARAIALLSYRNYYTYLNTQGEDDNSKLDNFKSSSYQQYQGDKLQKRFHAFAYWTLSKAMDSHNVGRNRGSIEQALKQIKARTLVIGIKTDILFPPEEQKLLAYYIPNAIFKEIDSPYGHDGFLIENETIENLIQEFILEKIN